MANNSGTVATDDVITAAQYNNLRTDAIGPYGDERVFPDSTALKFGTGEDVSFEFNGTDLQVSLSASASILWGDTSNANMTQGITINQGSADDEIIALKSSDVAHGMTSLSETDTFASMQKIVGADGGLEITGYSDSGRALQLKGRGATEATDDTTSSTGNVHVAAQLKSGTSAGALGSTGNIFAVQNYTTTRFVIKGNGDIHASDTDGNTALDAYDDAKLVRAVELSSNRKGIIKDQWDEFVTYNETDLIDAGLYNTPRSEGGLLNISQLMRLHNGAIWQLATKVMNLESQLALKAGN